MTLGVAVVGLGVGEAHARAYASNASCELRWLLDHDATKADRIAKELGQGRTARDLDSILKDPSVDVMSIASFDQDHHRQTVEALHAGKHVFVEKPICLTMDELHDIHAAWKAGGGRQKLSSNLVLRAAPLYTWLRTALQDGSLGRAYALDADYLYGRVEKITDGWRRDVKDYSVMAGGGVHLVDLLMWLTGQRPVRVQAVGNQIATQGTAFKSDDYAAAQLTFPDGAVARVTANFGCVHPHQHVVRVFGTKATFLYDDAGARIQRSRERGARSEPIPHAPKPQDKGALIHPFIDAILRDEDLSAHTRGIFDAMSVCIAIDRAKATGEPTGVEYL